MKKYTINKDTGDSDNLYVRCKKKGTIRNNVNLNLFLNSFSAEVGKLLANACHVVSSLLELVNFGRAV